MHLTGSEVQKIAETIHKAWGKHGGRIPVCIFTKEDAFKTVLEDNIASIRTRLFDLGMEVSYYVLTLGSEGLFFMDADQARFCPHPGWMDRITIPFEKAISEKPLSR